MEKTIIHQEHGLANDAGGNVEVVVYPAQGDSLRFSIELRRDGQRTFGFALTRDGVKILMAAMLESL